MAVSTKKRATYTDNDKNGDFVDPATEKTVKYVGEKIKKNIKHNIVDKINPIKMLSKINIKGKIVKGITFLFFIGAIIFLVLIAGVTISDTNLSLIKPRLSEDQVEDIKAKIEYLDILTKRKIVTYENEAARKCDWTYVISAVLGKNNNNLDNLYEPESGTNILTTYKGGYVDTIKKYYKQYNLAATDITEYEIYGLIYVESTWDPNAVSSSAFGLCQFQVGTIEEQLGPGADPFDPVQAIHACCKYLSFLYSQTGDLEGALTSYNSGLGNYLNGQWRFNEENREYARKVLNAAEEYRKGTLTVPNASILGVAYIGGNYLGEAFDAFLVGNKVQDINSACEKLGLSNDEKDLTLALINNKEYYNYYFGDDYDFSFKFLNSSYSGASGNVNGIPVYYQYDPRWADIAYSGETIKQAGCCPTSTAMVVSWLGNKGVDISSIDINKDGQSTPDEMATYFTMIGANADYSGSYGWGVTRTCFSLGVAVTETSDINNVCNALADGKPVIINLKQGIVSAGHFAVAVGIEDGMIMLNDPGYAKNDYTSSGTKFDFDTIDYSMSTAYIIEYN